WINRFRRLREMVAHKRHVALALAQLEHRLAAMAPLDLAPHLVAEVIRAYPETLGCGVGCQRQS
ncbi:MAG: hypothetical protein M1602_06365, partial [Firmicutes bacterium]|nr:hypothetical protein [Bacillota bacterium]